MQGEVRKGKLGEPPFSDGRAHAAHKVGQEVEVVDGEEVAAERVLGRDLVQIGARILVGGADRAGARLVDHAHVGRKLLLVELEQP